VSDSAVPFVPPNRIVPPTAVSYTSTDPDRADGWTIEPTRVQTPPRYSHVSPRNAPFQPPKRRTAPAVGSYVTEALVRADGPPVTVTCVHPGAGPREAGLAEAVDGEPGADEPSETVAAPASEE
jgi:hypothetical protein